MVLGQRTIKIQSAINPVFLKHTGATGFMGHGITKIWKLNRLIGFHGLIVILHLKFPGLFAVPDVFGPELRD
jgi:hypothetical protein